MTSIVSFTVNEAAIRRLGADLAVRRALLETAERHAAVARLNAPRMTGAGSQSIQVEPVLDGGVWVAHVSWDREHYYMHFHERGTQHMPPRPFLVPAFT